MENIIRQIRENILSGNTQTAMDATKQAIQQGYATETIINDAFNPAFKELGIRMRSGDIFITDVLMSSRAMRSALYILKPFLAEYSGKTKGVVVIGTVAGDLHDIGKDLIVMALMGSGFTVIDLGIDVTKEIFKDAVCTYHPQVLALSALLTTTMPEMQKVIEYLEECSLRQNVKIIVGGGPVTKNFAEEIHADAYASDIYEALNAVEDLVAGRKGSFTIKK